MMAHNAVAIWFSDQRYQPGVTVKRWGTKLAQDYSISKPQLKSFQSVGRKCENIIIFTGAMQLFVLSPVIDHRT